MTKEWRMEENRWRQNHVIILQDKTEIKPGDLCYILVHVPSRWMKAELIKTFDGTGNSTGNYKIIKTGEIVSAGRTRIKGLKP